MLSEVLTNIFASPLMKAWLARPATNNRVRIPASALGEFTVLPSLIFVLVGEWEPY